VPADAQRILILEKLAQPASQPVISMQNWLPGAP